MLSYINSCLVQFEKEKDTSVVYLMLVDCDDISQIMIYRDCSSIFWNEIHTGSFEQSTRRGTKIHRDCCPIALGGQQLETKISKPNLLMWQQNSYQNDQFLGEIPTTRNAKAWNFAADLISCWTSWDARAGPQTDGNRNPWVGPDPDLIVGLSRVGLLHIYHIVYFGVREVYPKAGWLTLYILCSRGSGGSHTPHILQIKTLH